MILHRKLPDSVVYNGKQYKLMLSFDRVLEFFGLQDEPLSDAEKLDLALYLFVKTKHKNDPRLLKAVLDLLFDPTKEGGSGEKCLDFVQDAAYIYAAFRQAYGINLYSEHGKLHWLEFVALLNALPSNTRLMEIIQIRVKPIPKANKHNAEEIREIMKQKAAFKLKISDEERREAAQKDLARMVKALEGWARGKS